MYLFIDFETYSPIDIKCGVRKYLSHPDADIICGVFKLIGQDRICIDGLSIERLNNRSGIDAAYVGSLFNNAKYIVCHNIEFDLEVYLRILQQKYDFPKIPENIKFICTKKRQDFFGQPSSLKDAANWYQLEQRKDTRGKELIRLLSMPKKDGTRNYDETLENEMLQYCIQDIHTLNDLFFTQMDFAKSFRIKNNDYAIQCLDLKINRTGMPVNLKLAEELVKVAEAQTAKAQLDACKLVDDFNLPSLTQTAALKKYIKEKFGYDAVSFDDKKQTHEKAPELVQRLLELRNVCNKNSLSKAQVILDNSVNNRLHNQLKYCGAHTGRWAGRDFQPQNLPRASDENDPASYVRNTISCGNKTTLIVMDYASIEHRALFYLAVKFMESQGFKCEDTRKHFLKFFTKDDPYIEIAAKIYDIPKEQITKKSRERQVGKTPHLGLGYGMGVNKFIVSSKQQANLDFTEEEAKKIVDIYRSTYTMIPKLWYYLIGEFIALVDVQEEQTIDLFHGMTLTYKPALKNDRNCLMLQLPNGRPIFYYDLRLEEGEYNGRPRKSLKVGNFYVHGGELVENLVQAFCRDLLADDMLLLDSQLEKGRIVLHVHD